jgi:kanamycin kinase
VVPALAGADAVRVVWENEVGGLTFEVWGRGERRFVKWSPPGAPDDLVAEAERLGWVRRYHPVPEVLDQGRDDEGAWLVTRALDGRSAVDVPWCRRPADAVTAMGEGLRALHDALPVGACPFSWSAAARVADASAALAAGALDPAGWHDEHRALGVAGALEAASAVPPVDEVVVCHGDACAPNTIVGEDGRWCGHVDLGRLGVADRWADLAVATWSTAWNYGPGWEGRLLAAYGIDPDPDRIRYYRLLWDLSS